MVMTRQLTARGTVQKQMSPTLTTEANIGVVVERGEIMCDEIIETGLVGDESRYRVARAVISPDGLCTALSTCTGGGLHQKIIDTDEKLRIRILTPREYYRLMGFSDEAFDKAASVCSKTQLYKQAGNSIVVNVLEAIFRELYLTEQKTVKMGKLEDYL